MDGTRQPMPLRERAEECIKQLQELKTKAESARRFHRTSPTPDLLTRVERDVNDSLRFLQAWITQFTKGKQTGNSQIIGTVGELFRSLEQSIDAAYDALSSRLRHRRLWLVGFILHKRLDSTLLSCASLLKWAQETIRASSKPSPARRR